MIRGVPLATWALRAVVVLGPLVAVLAPATEGTGPSLFVVLVVLMTALGWAFSPDHVLGGVSMLVVVVWWTTVIGTAMPLVSVVAAAGLLVSHVAATLLGYGPPRAVVHPAVLRSWALRTVLVWPAALVIWLVADAYSGRATPTTFWLLGLAGALVAALVAGFWLPMRQRAGR